MCGRYERDPDFPAGSAEAERASREALVRHANGYFDTLQFNNGEIRGTRFSPNATRNENGLLFTKSNRASAADVTGSTTACATATASWWMRCAAR